MKNLIITLYSDNPVHVNIAKSFLIWKKVIYEDCDSHTLCGITPDHDLNTDERFIIDYDSAYSPVATIKIDLNQINSAIKFNSILDQLKIER